MKAIKDVRTALRGISGAFTDLPPAHGTRGDQEGVRPIKTLWSPPDASDDQMGLVQPELPIEEEDYSSDEQTPEDSEFEPAVEFGADVDPKLPLLGNQQREAIRQSVLLHGVDALGWYASFHITGYQWGAYVKISGIAYLITNVFQALPVSLETKAKLGFHAILNHELFHFATDYAIGQAELVNREPWWCPAKELFQSRNPGYCREEEMMANAYMLKSFRTAKPSLRVRGKQEALKAFVQAQPEGYKEGWKVKPGDWDRHLDSLALCYLEASREGKANPHLHNRQAYDWPAQFPIYPRIPWRHCPIHLVDDRKRLGIPEDYLNFFGRLETIEETPEFKAKLRKLSSQHQNAWASTKVRLQTCITRGADFKKWDIRNSLWSARINSGYRVHFQQAGTHHWRAIDIGNHKEMGHG